ncbi:hypothetical protein [Colwellia sp. Bg11-28]|uniref:hypothetical protein n=1 Tax=Colwellia sp. Bg11-28 TaxID=2058305 RepID=UPI000C31DE95|nr:hypothetical protein [Colwellia sp. Bg11-28]PKH88264.1 hypothetical protein CXF79_05740 [Colwellia sp. Bg11-28]
MVLDFGKIPVKVFLFLFSLLFVLLSTLVAVNIYKDKPFYFNDKRFGFGESSNEEVLKKKSEYEEQLKEKKLRIKKLTDEIASLKKVKCVPEIKKENPTTLYSRIKEVYLEEQFSDSKAGVKIYIVSLQEFEGEWLFHAAISIPESGDFRRQINLSDKWEFFNNNKKYSLSFIKFDHEKPSITLRILEI